MLVDGKRILDAQIAHIRATSPQGQRHDPSWTRDKLDAAENLLLLCAPHHKLIDGDDAEAFPVEELERWKEQQCLFGSRPAVTAWRAWPTLAELDPLAAGVHPSWPHGGGTLPVYVPRDLDPTLGGLLGQAAVQGGMVLVAGDVACGKSRLVFEVARRELSGHLACLVPVGGLRAAITAVMQCPSPCVLWLDDLGHHVDRDQLHGLDIAELRRSRVLVLATVEVRYLPVPPDLNRLGGTPMGPVLSTALVDQAQTVFLDRSWSPVELQHARAAEDRRVRAAAQHCVQRGVSEYLMAGPVLWAAWQAAWRIGGNPRAAALVRAAVDLARAGLRGPLSKHLLTRAHRYYLADAGGHRLRPEPLKEAFAWADRTRIGMTSLLEPGADGTWRPCSALLEHLPQSLGAIHPLLWFEALGGAVDLSTSCAVACNAQREDPSMAAWLWRVLREAGLPGVVNQEAASLIEQGRCEQALRLLRENADPADPLSRRVTVWALKGLGNCEEAEAACHEALALGETDILDDLAQLQLHSGRPDQAERTLRRAARAGTKDGWFNLGVFLADRGKTDQAIRAYQQAVRGGDKAALRNLGQLLVGAGRNRAAEKALRQAVDHGDAEAQLDLANLLKQLGRTDEARQIYLQLIDQGDARAWINLGNLHVANHQPARAEHAYRQAIAQGLSAAHGYLGHHLVVQGRCQEAVPYLRRAVDEGHPDAAFDLGRALKTLGQSEQARDAFRVAAQAGEPLAAVGFAAVAADTDGVERDTLLQQAARNGDPDAMFLVMLDLDRSGHPRRAKALRRRLADCGDPIATALLAAYSQPAARDTG
ncbi:tetratricopeptide repeat protein [Streptacidiphilus sp. N1-10]|uniref:Tetratricopeptide repeat protein n=1 Tax=Streptacidiphilus jeojiensis TaxID=3229225 RepID=A0ABV6XXX1_9ACTN